MTILEILVLVCITSAATVPYETHSGNLFKQLLESQICTALPTLPSCRSLNETVQLEGDSSPAVDNIFTNNPLIMLILDYLATTQRENTELKAREIEHVAQIAKLEQTKEELGNKLRSLEVDWLPTVGKNGRSRLEVSQEPISSEKSYQATASLLRPVDCSDYLLVGAHRSGIYDIYPFKCRCSEPVQVWCDMETDGGGWTVILNRQYSTNPVNFTQPWVDYQKGFGNVSTEYWIGNENLHMMTNTRKYSLRLDFEEEGGNFRFAEWSKFVVGNEAARYKLDVPLFESHSMTDNCMAQHNGKYFSTFDYDNDGSSSINCAKVSGWWYHNCASLNPTIPFDTQGLLNSACTYKVNGKNVALRGPSMQLKIRPNMCSQMVKAVHFNTHTCQGHNGL